MAAGGAAAPGGFSGTAGAKEERPAAERSGAILNAYVLAGKDAVRTVHSKQPLTASVPAEFRNCAVTSTQRVVGPSFREISQRYAGDGAAAGRLADKIRSGGVGVWGQIPMPPHPQLNSDQAGALARWILAGS
jgi:cytochrome c